MMKRTLLVMLLMAVLLGFATAPGAKTASKDPYMKADESWISISGTAVDTLVDSFTLDYGEGLVSVEMDGWGWYNQTFNVIEGDKVTVYGKIDDDLYETTSIGASSVYDENLGTYFYANSADEEYDEDYDYWVVGEAIVVGQTTVRGTVTGVNGREFTIDNGPRKLTVDTSTMGYNPMDKKGFQAINKGDYVSVSGSMKNTFWDKRKLMADVVVTLYDD
jgi:uncharacterized protein YdeI (BOF family)